MEKLVFSPEHCRLLGLEPDEPVRHLASGARTVLLERLGGEASSALPWDRDLVLTADIGSFSLADILQLLHASAKSGFLFFESQDHAKSVYLHRGEVVFASSNQAFDRLGECLVRSGALTIRKSPLTAIEVPKASLTSLPISRAPIGSRTEFPTIG